jgi:hypothetical protein
MKLPQLTDPDRYEGLYVFDFGEQCAVGYTAGEIAVLLESERHRNGKVYKIHRAYANGRLELVGVPTSRFLTEDGFFFYRHDPQHARDDYTRLLAMAGEHEPPCRAKLQLARLPGADIEHVVVLIYPAEYNDQMSRWLLEAEYRGGDLVEGGVSQVTSYYQGHTEVIERAQLWGVADGTSRPADEVLASTHIAVQR